MNSIRRNWLRHWPRGMQLLPLLALCGALLSSCASAPVVAPTACRSPALPATLTRDDSRSASDYSARVSDWLARVQSFLAD